MKKILFAILLALGVLTDNAHAISCAASLMPTFTSNQATLLCATFPISSTATATLKPNGDNTLDLGATSFSWRSLYLGTSRISKTSDILRVEQDANRLFTWDASSDTAFTATFGDAGTTAVQKLTLSASTPDADDDSTVQLCGGGAYAADGSRGACILLPGEEVSGGGDISYVAGAGDTHVFSAGSTTTMTIGATGDVAAVGQLTSTGLNFPAANFETVAGAGSTVSDAAALSATKHIHQITGANGTLGWKFASATAGQTEILLSTTAGVPKVYAVAGGTCNGGGADVACTLVTGIVSHICYATAANAWICS